MKTFKNYLIEVEQALAPVAAPTTPAPATDDDGLGFSWDNAAGFKDAIKGKLGNIDPEAADMVEKLIVTEPDGTVDIDQTFYNMVEEFEKFGISICSNLITELIKNGKEAIHTPEYAQATPQEQASFLQSIKDMEAALPEILATEAKAKAELEKTKSMLQQNIKDRKLNNKVKGSPAQPAATMEELNRIKKLADLTDEDISFNGVTQHDNGDMTYRQGPISMRKNKDGSSDATATIGDTTARVQQSPIGIKTMTAQGPAADSIVGVDASAERTGVDPKKFAAFQKQNPAVKESSELIDMLRIAGLR